jgi:hypothetical protein
LLQQLGAVAFDAHRVELEVGESCQARAGWRQHQLNRTRCVFPEAPKEGSVGGLGLSDRDLLLGHGRDQGRQ